MSDAYAIWRAAEGLAKRKTVEIVFPELAAALNGATVTRQPLDVVAVPDPQPVCAHCRLHWARVTIGEGGTPICGLCVGQLPHPGPERDDLVRRDDWPKIGPIDRKKRR